MDIAMRINIYKAVDIVLNGFRVSKLVLLYGFGLLLDTDKKADVTNNENEDKEVQ